jgi:hypothetical protein
MKNEMNILKKDFLTYWDSFVKSNEETPASASEDNFEYIGSNDKEVYHNKTEMIDFYKSYRLLLIIY